MAREKGAVAHDDRLDALALGVEFLRSTMELDAVKVEAEVLEAFLEEHMEHPIHSAGHVVTSMVDGMELYWEDDDVNSNRFIDW